LFTVVVVVVVVVVVDVVVVVVVEAIVVLVVCRSADDVVGLFLIVTLTDCVVGSGAVMLISISLDCCNVTAVSFVVPEVSKLSRLNFSPKISVFIGQTLLVIFSGNVGWA
jgi:hypothetical protein